MAERRKLTPKVQDAFIGAIDDGVRPLVLLCAIAGINTATYRQWQDAWERGDDSEHERLDKFFTAVEKAKAERIQRWLQQMQLAGKDDWRMYKAIIHMADPENYPEKPEVSVTNNIPTNIILTWGDNDADANHTPSAA